MPDDGTMRSMRRNAIQFAACSIAGVVATFMTHPLDTYVVHKMTDRPIDVRLKNLYRGVVPACGQAVLIYGAMLGTYEVARDCGFGIVVASTLAAFPESAVKGPLEAVKNRKQTSKPWPKNVFGRFRILGLGTFGMLCREVPGNIAYFTAYETARRENCSPLQGRSRREVSRAVAYPIDAMRTQFVTGRRHFARHTEVFCRI